MARAAFNFTAIVPAVGLGGGERRLGAQWLTISSKMIVVCFIFIIIIIIIIVIYHLLLVSADVSFILASTPKVLLRRLQTLVLIHAHTIQLRMWYFSVLILIRSILLRYTLHSIAYNYSIRLLLILID